MFTPTFTNTDYEALDRGYSSKRRGYAFQGSTLSLADIGGFLSCQDGIFLHRRLDFTQKYFGKMRTFFEIVFETANRDGQVVCCARCYFEVAADGTPVFHHYLFTTNDPLAADNFNRYRQGIDNAKALGQCVEQGSFCEAKVLMDLAKMTPEQIFEEFMTSRFTSSDFLRELIGSERTSHIPKEKPLPVQGELSEEKDKLEARLRDIKDEILDYESEELKHKTEAVRLATDIQQVEAALEAVKAQLKPVKAEFEARVAEQLKQIRAVLATCTVDEIYQPFKAWACSKLGQSTTLHPFKAYKSVGRNLPMNKEAVKAWDEFSFLSVLSTRWMALQNSPMEQLLFCMDFRHPTEASKDDKLWAVCLNGRKLHDKWFETPRGRDFIFTQLEKVAVQQHNFGAELKGYCEAGTEEGDNLAFEFLTAGTRQLTQKLGLTQYLMKELWTGSIKFSDGLNSRIQEAFKTFGIDVCEFRPADLVDRPSHLGSDLDMLLSLGAPVA
jgi:hypothetical protein